MAKTKQSATKTRLLRIIREHAYAAWVLTGAGDPASADAERKKILADEKLLRDFVREVFEERSQ